MLLLYAVVALAAACAGDRPMLNSERIEAVFGNYAVEVLEAGDRQRIANLYSTKDGIRTMRTYATVRFALPVDESLREEHALVVSGRSLGSVFKSRGWRITKRNERIASVTLTAADRGVATLMHVDLPCNVALHRYAFLVEKGGGPIQYAVITELHHPDYLTVADLESIYGKTAK